MKKIYSRVWQDIKFNSFASLSKTKLADQQFYDNFYESLFEKYSGYEELNEIWRKQKLEVAEFLYQFLYPCSRFLSIGCGLGYIESVLWNRLSSQVDIHVQDFSEVAVRWIKNEIPVTRIHGLNWNDDSKFDVIYLGAVDYALDDPDLITMLKHCKSKLSRSGKVILVSASFLDNTSFEKVILSSFKDFVKYILEIFGFFDRGQFWGWMRSREEYISIFEKSGFENVDSGFIETESQKTFFLTAY